MRILHVITSLDRGGAETQLLTLARMQATDHSVSVFSLRQGALDSIFRSSGVAVVGPQKSNFFSAVLALKQLMDSMSFDVLHAHLPRAEIVSRVALLRRRIPFFITRHNMETFVPDVRQPFIFLSTLVSRWITKRAFLIIAISNSVRHFLLGKGEIHPKSNITTIYYGFDPVHYRASNRVNSDRKFRIGTISRLVDQKRIDVLLEAFSIVRQTEPRITLQIIGSGEKEGNLKELAKSLSLDDVTSWVSNTDERLELLSRFEIFILASSYEGFGLVLLEAIQMGVPILASHNSAIVEVLGDEYVGLFPTGDSKILADKIRYFLQLSTIQKRLIMSYLNERLALFSSETMYNSIIQKYQQGIKRGC